MDEVLRIEAKNKTLLQEAEQAEIAANGEFTDPTGRKSSARTG
jgi:hypothetical protein